MRINISSTIQRNGHAAATFGAWRLQRVLADRDEANIIVATGASQFEMLKALNAAPHIEWNRVNVFHLDEYVGLRITHPASFRKYLWERFHSKLSRPLKSLFYINAEEDVEKECERLSKLIARHPIDLCFAGIGENAHLAFNDPPADFETTKPYLVVSLDEACRRQQFGEGWFSNLNDVPKEAISMSIHQIMLSKCIVITASEARKAKAVAESIEGPVTPQVPSSILQQHPDTHLFLDPLAASLLKDEEVPA
jgi:glucosamine-6-phosphate deaminase